MGDVIGPTAPKQVTIGDMKRANVPERFWSVKLQAIPDFLTYKEKLRNYLRKMEELMAEGIGLYLWSDENSTGKTSAAVLIVKQAIRLRKTVFFEESDRLKSALMRSEYFEENVTLEDRVRTVDLLVLDDVGKEYRTETGYAENRIESILRDRSQNLRVTVITSNIAPGSIEKVYSPDLSALLRETTIPVEVTGYDWRAEKAKILKGLI